jgi:hypothetical protein
MGDSVQKVNVNGTRHANGISSKIKRIFTGGAEETAVCEIAHQSSILLDNDFY